GGRDLEAELLQPLAALRERLLPERGALPEKDVEGDEPGRRLRRQLPNAALGRMQPHLQEGEPEPAPLLADDLAVARGVRRKRLAELAQLREVAEQRPAVTAPQRELVAVVLEHAAEAVPLRLVLPAVAERQLVHELGFHGWEGDVRPGHRSNP